MIVLLYWKILKINMFNSGFVINDILCLDIRDKWKELIVIGEFEVGGFLNEFRWYCEIWDYLNNMVIIKVIKEK